MKLAGDIDIRHLSGPEWVHLLAAFKAPPRLGPPREKTALLLRILCGETVVKFWHSEQGRLSPKDCRWDESTRSLSDRFGGARVVSLDTDALTKLLSQWQIQLDPGGDYIDQLLSLVSLMGRVEHLDLYPSPSWLGIPTFLRSTILNVLLPKKHCLVFLITKNEKVWTSIILRHGNDGVDLLTGSEAFYDKRPSVVEPSWIHELCALVKDHYGPIHGAVSFDWQAYWNFRRQPSRDYLTQLKEQEKVHTPFWPFTWTVGQWTIDRAHRKKLKRMSLEDQKLYSDPLECGVLEELL